MNETKQAAVLAKNMCVLAGELLECFQWDEVHYETDAAKHVLTAMQKTLHQLQNTVHSDIAKQTAKLS